MDSIALELQPHNVTCAQMDMSVVRYREFAAGYSLRSFPKLVLFTAYDKTGHLIFEGDLGVTAVLDFVSHHIPVSATE